MSEEMDLNDHHCNVSSLYKLSSDSGSTYQ